MKIGKIIFYWLPPILWAGLIFSLSGVPNLNSGLEAFWDVFLRKLAHATEFGIPVLFLFRAFRGYNFSFWKSLIFSFFLAVAFAFSDEFHQLFVIDRQGKLFDVLIDSLGILLINFLIVFWNFSSLNLGDYFKRGKK